MCASKGNFKFGRSKLHSIKYSYLYLNFVTKNESDHNDGWNFVLCPGLLVFVDLSEDG